MIKVINSATGVGSEVKLRNFSEPLQDQKETTSYSSRFVYPIDFGLETVDVTNILLYENQMIHIWREMAKNPYIDFAIDDIVNEMISYTPEEKYPIGIDLNNTSFSKAIRNKIHDEWIFIMKLLMFNKKSYTLLRDWYIDGKQYFYVEHNNNSITKLTVLDPIRTKKNIDKSGKITYIYQDVDLEKALLEIPEENIVNVNSGLMDDKHQIWISYLNKAYVPLNQLNNIEDALLIYRIARAPERRVFYIDVGQLPKSKAETYMKEVIRNCRNKMEYDSSTGKIKESVLHMSLLDDIYLPRSAEGRSTEVSTLQGGASLGETSDLDYFKMKLFRSLNVPFTRWSDPTGMSMMLGRSAEITRDELKYRKFIYRLRVAYESIFFVLLRKQLALKKIATEDELNNEYENIQFDWSSDSMFAEFRDLEVMTERLNVVERMMNLPNLFSTDYIHKKILRFDDEEIEKMKEEIKANPAPAPEEGGEGGFGGFN